MEDERAPVAASPGCVPSTPPSAAAEWDEQGMPDLVLDAPAEEKGSGVVGPAPNHYRGSSWSARRGEAMAAREKENVPPTSCRALGVQREDLRAPGAPAYVGPPMASHERRRERWEYDLGEGVPVPPTVCTAHRAPDLRWGRDGGWGDVPMGPQLAVAFRRVPLEGDVKAPEQDDVEPRRPVSQEQRGDRADPIEVEGQDPLDMFQRRLAEIQENLARRVLANEDSLDDMRIARSCANVPDMLGRMTIVSFAIIRNRLAIVIGGRAEDVATCPSREWEDHLCPNDLLGIVCPLSHECLRCPGSFHVRAFCTRRLGYPLG